MDEKKPAVIDPKELAAAKEQAKATSSTYTHVFNNPFTYENETYKTLTFDFGRLTGNDAIAIQDELETLGKAVLLPVSSAPYLLRMAARACTVPIAVNVISAMPIFDFNKITGKARSFLLRSGL